MDGMDAGPASDLGSLSWFTATWLLMMAAMLLPSLAPALPAQGPAGPAGARQVVADDRLGLGERVHSRLYQAGVCSLGQDVYQ